MVMYMYAHRSQRLGRDLRKFLIQPPFEKKVSQKIGVICFNAVESWKRPRMESAQQLWTTSATSGFFLRMEKLKRSFSFVKLGTGFYLIQ